MGWKPEVQVAGEGERWHRNALIFATEAEAFASAKNLWERWTLVTAFRATEVAEAATHKIEGYATVPLGPGPEK